VASVVPSVWAGDRDFFEATLEWYDDVDNLDNWLVADGPEPWDRIEAVEERLQHPQEITSSGAVSDIVVEDHRISFTTTAVGVPHLVKVSYFPNWQAVGADGPYRAAPSLMVVIPTESDVVIEFSNTWTENLGMLLTVAALMALAGFALWQRRAKPPIEV
jgi:hypothetical protein